MKVILKNGLGCELNTWDSVEEMVTDIVRGELVFSPGDTLRFETNRFSDALLDEGVAVAEDVAKGRY